jgi:hypothetical protein
MVRAPDAVQTRDDMQADEENIWQESAMAYWELDTDICL